ncbi:hypothetical protein [Mycobacterium sp. E740]|uniref:hypothetical protein n=1 Tax=Mycobacterium sp. E740 TaxID=1834149 RepID=UPI000A3F5852|nr:hypothetical protein [Mycobacterium sp. E740]
MACDSSIPDPNSAPPTLPAFTTTSAPQSAPTSPKTGSDAGDGADYSRLLLKAADLSDAEDTFAVRSTSPVPDGLPGASALFVNDEDSRAISDTIVIYPDAQTATKTLRDSLPAIDKIVSGGTTRSVPVGADGTMAVGTTPDGSKAATLLLFTEGPALVRLEFESAPGDATTDEFVVSVGKMQQIALRTGLHPPQ